MNQQPAPRAWDDEDNKPVIPKIPHPRPAEALGATGPAGVER